MTAVELSLIRQWSMLNGGGWKTSPGASLSRVRAGDGWALRTSTVGPPPLSIAHEAALLAVRLWL